MPEENIVGIVCGTSEVWGGSTLWLLSKCSQRHFHKMPLKTNRFKLKVAVCGQNLGYDRSNEGIRSRIRINFMFTHVAVYTNNIS